MCAVTAVRTAGARRMLVVVLAVLMFGPGTYGYLPIPKQRTEWALVSDGMSRYLLEYGYKIPVREYGVRNLCSNEDGLIRFFSVIRTKMCKTSDTFVASFVLHMCKEQDRLLYLWVAELFDIDGDGYINIYEQQNYT